MLEKQDHSQALEEIKKLVSNGPKQWTMASVLAIAVPTITVVVVLIAIGRWVGKADSKAEEAKSEIRKVALYGTQRSIANSERIGRMDEKIDGLKDGVAKLDDKIEKINTEQQALSRVQGQILTEIRSLK